MNSIPRQGNKQSDSVRGIPFEQEGRFRIARWAPIPLRLIVGYGFMARVTILSEVFGGLAIILGA
jgi:hypothetical protein